MTDPTIQPGETLEDFVRRIASEAVTESAAKAAPEVPKVEWEQDAEGHYLPQSPEDVQAFATAMAEFRKEVAAMRAELAASRGAPKFQTAVTETLEDRRNARLEAISQHSHYCPGCGQLYDYPQKCRGTVEGPHAPIEVVTTDELAGDPANHTAAPNTDVLAA